MKMKHEVETELKMLLSERDFNKLVACYKPDCFIRQHNYYFVSDDVSHYAFRIRVKGDEQLFTLKEKVNGETVEHEKLFTGRMEDDPEIVRLLDQMNVQKPYAVFGELITYRAVMETDLAEICFDVNHYNGKTDYEIEYEIKQDHDYEAAFRAFLQKADIEFKPNKKSKYKRCLKSINK